VPTGGVVDWAGIGVGVGGAFVVGVGDGVGVVACGRLVLGRAPAEREGVAPEGDCRFASARALFTAAAVSCWRELPVTPKPSPSSETASRQPPVAVAAPSSQAATATRIRARTNARLARPALRRGKDRLNGRAARHQATHAYPICPPDQPGPDNVRIVAQLLLVEDDAAIRGALIRALTERGHAVTSTASAMEALQQVVDAPPDLVILDLGLPGLDGYEALRMLRAISKVPVVVATARDDEADIIRALDAGADDYLVKPYGTGQIEARIRAVLRRAAGADDRRSGPISVGALRLDPEAYEATLGGVPLDLSRREFDLLHYLALHAGQVVTKRDLLTHVWRLPYGGADKTVDVHVSWLRRKLGENAQQPRYLHTVRGVGLKLTAPP
jgi:two-component system, OmpR family, KDP operon response regulator KdpE